MLAYYLQKQKRAPEAIVEYLQALKIADSASLEEAEAKALKIADWTGESADEIIARFEIPHESILEDMADWQSAQRNGFSFS